MTVINVFTVAPEQQARVVELLRRATEASIRHIPRFVAAALHRGLDGTKVTMYAQSTRLMVAAAAPLLWWSMACQSARPSRDKSSSSAPQPFVLSSFPSTYPFAGSVSGEVSIGEDSIRVRIDSGVVQNRMPPVMSGATRLDTLEIRAGLAAEDSGSWRVDIIGPPAFVAAVLAPGESVLIRPTRLAVARPAAVAIDSRWLVFELRANHHGINGRPPGPVTTYICSDHNLAGSPGASARRAALLKLAYNQAC